MSVRAKGELCHSFSKDTVTDDTKDGSLLTRIIIGGDRENRETVEPA